MYKNKLIQILTTFSKKEMTRFYEFVQSPYFNKHGEVNLLAGYLNKTYPEFTEKNCNRKTIYKSIFPKKVHDQKHLALLFTYLIRLCNDFLVQEHFKGNLLYHKVLLLRELRDRKQYKYYEKTMQNFEKEIDASLFKNSNYYNVLFLKAAEADAYFTQQARYRKDHSIQQKQNNLDHYYLSEKLKDACEMIVRSKILEIDYSTSLLDAVVGEVKKNLALYEQIPSISIYFHIYQMIFHDTPKYYYKALKNVQENSIHFPKSELQNIYNYFQNYCIQQINKGERPFLTEMFNLYKDQLEKELLTDSNGFLSQWHYKNIVTTGIRLREMEWTREFIESFKKSLRPDVLENAYSFNLASYFYSAGKLEKVLDLLLKVEYTDIQYNLGAKSLLLRTYYDLDEQEALLSHTHAFKQYLNRNRLIPETRRRGMSNLVRFTNRASQIKANLDFVAKEKSQKELEKLKDEMKSTDPIINRDWLDAKVEDLQKSISGNY